MHIGVSKYDSQGGQTGDVGQECKGGVGRCWTQTGGVVS